MPVDYGSYVSHNSALETNPANWDTVVFKKNSPLSSGDLTLLGELERFHASQEMSEIKSGILDFFLDSYPEDILGTRNTPFPTTYQSENEFVLQGFTAKVGRFIFPVRGSKVNGALGFNQNWNFIKMGSPPATGKRYDLVFLEVWRQLVQATGTTGKPDPNEVYPLGNTQWGDSGTNIPLDILDPNIAKESTGRAQIQYRIRVVEQNALSQDPMLDPLVLAQGGAGSPVAGYTFTRDAKDTGLYIAGSGASLDKIDLNNPDGLVFAIPMFLVFRRNSQAYVSTTNKNGSDLAGSSISVVTSDPSDPSYTPSDRPDEEYADEITVNDIVMDLRHAAMMQGVDYQTLLEREFHSILSGQNQILGKEDSFGTVAAANKLLQIDGISFSGIAGIDDIHQPDEFRRVFSDAKRHQNTHLSILEGVNDIAGVLQMWDTGHSSGNNDVIQVDAPAVPVGSVAGVGNFVTTFGNPVARWRTSGLPVVFTNAGQSTTTLNLRRAMISEDGISYEEIKDMLKIAGPKTLQISEYFTALNPDAELVIGCDDPFNRISLEMTSEINSLVGNIELEYYDEAGVWNALALTQDTTKAPAVTGPSLRQNGDLDFTPPAGWKSVSYQGGAPLYYVRIKRVATPGFSFRTTINSLDVKFTSAFWTGFNTDKVWAQIDIADPDYAAGDLVDIFFDIKFPFGDGLSFVPESFLKAWRDDGSLLHDLAFVEENQEYREKLIEQRFTFSSEDYQASVRDYNPRHANYSIDFGSLRSLLSFVEANGTDTIAGLPGLVSAADLGTEVSADALIKNYYRFEVEDTPGSGTYTDLEVVSLTRTIAGTYTVVFTAPVVAGRVIRYEAVLESQGFIYARQEKGIIETLSTEEVSIIAPGAGTTFDFVFDNEVLSYETMHNPMSMSNDPIAYIDAIPLDSTFTRESNIVSVTIKNRHIVTVEFAAPPGAGADIRLTCIVVKAIPLTDEWRLAYQHAPYQGISHTSVTEESGNELPVPEELQVLAVTKYHTLHSIGTGLNAKDTQRDPRFLAMGARLPLPSWYKDSHLHGDAIKLDSSRIASMYSNVSISSNQSDDNIGTALIEGLNLKIEDDLSVTDTAKRGLDHRSILVEPDFEIDPYALEFLVQKFKFATSLVDGQEVTTALNFDSVGQLVIGSLVKDNATKELYVLIVTVMLSGFSVNSAFQAVSTNRRIAFDLFNTRHRILD